MSGYVIAQIEVTNPENYKEYLVRGGEFEHVEGEWKHSRNIIVKFPSYERALEWYNSEEYKPVRQIRMDNSNTNQIIIRGL